MADKYKRYRRGLSSPAERHFSITPQDGVDLPDRPRVLKVITAGDLNLRDIDGNTVIYTVTRAAY